ncbi:MAG: GH3 auxin-responsive promoter family protein [Chitinophagales bacterium]|nr:GH3 auxin-responsive promoter family protein [Chitinophagales bacterium]
MLYSFFNTLIKGYLKYRSTRIHAMRISPFELQKDILTDFTGKLKLTRYGKDIGAGGIENIKDFRKIVPINRYEDLWPYIDKMMHGSADELYPGTVSWFAKSSGTTNDKSKFIPITDENLFENHVAASWDAMSILYKNHPDARNFEGKNLIMGGSLTTLDNNITVGDVSAILLNRMPMVGRPFYTPDFETALLADWEAKIESIARITTKESVVMFAGVPTWTIVLFKRILELTGKDNMREVWPDAKTYMHGGVGFDPYRSQFNAFFPDNDIEYYEVYNASEGYFAIQDRVNEKGMLLLLDNAIFYEFIPIDQIDNHNPDILTLEDVETDKNYCMVITTASGLWRYIPGDVIKFVSTNPYRIMVTGRTKHYINVFGEEVMVHNTDSALKQTCEIFNVKVIDYMVAPVYMENNNQGGHEWWIEFAENPIDKKAFAEELDKNLRAVNSDYDAKRYKDMALVSLKLNFVKKDTFSNWLKQKGRLGGQSKIPRLVNDRNASESLIAFLYEQN